MSTGEAKISQQCRGLHRQCHKTGACLTICSSWHLGISGVVLCTHLGGRGGVHKGWLAGVHCLVWHTQCQEHREQNLTCTTRRQEGHTTVTPNTHSRCHGHNTTTDGNNTAHRAKRVQERTLPKAASYYKPSPKVPTCCDSQAICRLREAQSALSASAPGAALPSFALGLFTGLDAAPAACCLRTALGFGFGCMGGKPALSAAVDGS